MIRELALVLALVATDDGKRIGDLWKPGDESAFVFEVGGEHLGEHWWTYEGEQELAGAKAHHFSGGVRLQQTTALGKVEVRATGELWVDDLGHPLKLALRAEAAGTKSSADVVFADGKASGSCGVGPTKRAFAVAAPPAAYALVNNWVGMLELLAGLRPPQPGAPVKVDLAVASGDGVVTIPFELRHQGTHATKRGDDVVEGEKFRDSLGEALKMAPDGKLLELEVPAQNVRIRRSDEPIEKFALEPAKPPRDDFDREEVVIRHGDVAIAGTLTRRKGTSGALPAVFFASGSGLQDREGISGGIDLGTHEILDRATEAGFLVLRVDDRGAGASTGPLADLSFDDLVEDARACVDFLLARSDVDAKRVFVIGHSEGGETAPILACERPIAGVVLLAAPGRTMFEILREQKKRALEEAGLPALLVEPQLEEHAKFLRLVSAEGPVDPSQVGLEYRPYLSQRRWFQSHAKHDALAQVKQVKCPVLIAQGAKDWQVSAELDAKALEKALRDAGHPDAKLLLFPELDHLFKRVAGGRPPLAEYLTERPVDPAFLDALAAWLVEKSKR
jgi:pimeloyl-ACP methyl ester carboxylesterase